MLVKWSVAPPTPPDAPTVAAPAYVQLTQQRVPLRRAAEALATADGAGRYPIVVQENEDISAHAFESRGLLHCVVRLGARMPDLHCINVHLGLFERGRQWQVRALCERIRETVPHDAPLIIAGDFNDWRRKADRTLVDQLGVVDVFRAVTGRPARTFPSVLPVFHLDRIYARGLEVAEARVHLAFPGARISDHAALAATFEVAPLRR